MAFMDHQKEKDKEKDAASGGRPQQGQQGTHQTPSGQAAPTPQQAGAKAPSYGSQPQDMQALTDYDVTKTQEKVAKDTTDKPTFTAKRGQPPDVKPTDKPPVWLQNALVCDQNKEDFIYVREFPANYNGMNFRAVCLKCGFQTFQSDKKTALDYLLNYHILTHIRDGARPNTPPLIGATAETMAPSGIPYGPQYGHAVPDPSKQASVHTKRSEEM